MHASRRARGGPAIIRRRSSCGQGSCRPLSGSTTSSAGVSGSVESFERLLVSELEPSVDLDRGARRLLRQTRFLAETFRSYQRRLSAAGRLDEHELRRLLIRDDASRPFSQIVVTIGDQTVDTAGLWSADFDLLTRLPGLEQIDVVATEAVLAAGFYERLAELLPGMAEERLDGADDQMPVLVAPAADDDRHHFVWRDREGELVAVIRVSERRSHGAGTRCRARVDRRYRRTGGGRLSTTPAVSVSRTPVVRPGRCAVRSA